jgi:hypothetical protein
MMVKRLFFMAEARIASEHEADRSRQQGVAAALLEAG